MTLAEKFNAEFLETGRILAGKDPTFDMLKFMEYVTQRVRRELNLPPKQKKHEKIEKMAWNIYLHFNAHPEAEFSMSKSWELAEKFYKFAKEKEQETNDETM